MRGTGQNIQQKANGCIVDKRGSTNHSQISTHDASPEEEEAKTEFVASTYGNAAHLTTGTDAGLGQFLISCGLSRGELVSESPC